MITPEQAQAVFLDIPVLEQEPGTGHTAYRVKGKLFATVWNGAGFANLRVGHEEQVMLTKDARIFSVPKNGPKGGWVAVSLANVSPEIFREVAWKAWRNTAPARLALQY